MNFWINIWHKVSPCPNTHHSIPCFPSLSVFLHIISLCKTLYTATPINLNVPIWILMTSIFMVTVMLLLKSNCSIPQGKNAATSIWKHHIWNKLVKFWTVQIQVCLYRCMSRISSSFILSLCSSETMESPWFKWPPFSFLPSFPAFFFL